MALAAGWAKGFETMSWKKSVSIRCEVHDAMTTYLPRCIQVHVIPDFTIHERIAVNEILDASRNVSWGHATESICAGHRGHGKFMNLLSMSRKDTFNLHIVGDRSCGEKKTTHFFNCVTCGSVWLINIFVRCFNGPNDDFVTFIADREGVASAHGDPEHTVGALEKRFSGGRKRPQTLGITVSGSQMWIKGFFCL